MQKMCETNVRKSATESNCRNNEKFPFESFKTVGRWKWKITRSKMLKNVNRFDKTYNWIAFRKKT